jgi:probable F420-dependent oxidoreductase
MKVRIGFGLGTRTALHGPEFGHVVDELERLGFDSLWVSERIGADAPDPLVAMSYAAGRTSELKFGMSVMVLPGRNPVVLAKSMATLSTMSNGRLLPAFGLGAVQPLEQQAFGVERSERARWFDESLSVMRQCWTGEPVVHDGERYRYDGVVVRPVPDRLDVWLGGFAPSELRRVGRSADGWLPSFITPDEAEAGRAVIESVAAELDREIEDDHYGVLIPYSLDGLPDAFVAQLARRRPDLDPLEIVPSGWDALRDLIEQFVAVGTTKFVVLPLDEPTSSSAWTDHLDELAAEILPLET